jgi:TonB family protein
VLGARSVRTLAALALVAALFTAPRAAHADDDPPVGPAPIVPPSLLAPVQAGYPEGAEGSAYVVIAVTVAIDGTVQNARILEGVEPFAGRALEAIATARFVPATRGGIAIASTIRFRIDFAKAAPAPSPAPEPPEPPPEPLAPPPVGPADGATPRVEADVAPGGEVLVRGGKGAVGAPIVDSLARAEVRQLPGAFGDPFRALEVATGVTPIVSGLPYFYVRGAPPGNVGYYFDGVRVPYLFHFGLGPSVIQPALVSRTDIHKGGYPAALGRWAGGVVDATATAPAEHAHGEGQLRIVDAGGLIEAPFANGKGSALAGGRYSYTSALFSLLDASTSLDYRDYQARITYAVTDRDLLSALAFGAYDRATQRMTPERDAIEAAVGNGPRPTDIPREIEIVLFASEFHRLDLRWDHALGGGGSMRLAGTLGYDRTRIEARRAAEDLMTATRLEIVQPVTTNMTVRAGADLVIDQYQADSLPQFADDDDVVDRQRHIFAKRTDFATGVRADAVVLLDKRMELTPGLRLDIYGSDQARAIGVDPRIAARFFVSDSVRIVHAYGLVTQPPSTPIALPAVSIARLEGGLQRSAQTSAGVEIDFPSDISGTATVFHQAFYDLNDALGTAQTQIIDIEQSDSLLGKSDGAAYGLELGVRRKLSRRVGGLVAYTLSRSTRTAENRNYLSSYDRPHVLNAALSLDLGRGVRAGSRLVFYTGGPTSAARPAYPGQIVGVPPERTPDFVRLDARLEKRWTIGTRGYVSVILEALNATLSKETTGYKCGTQLPLPGSQREPPSCFPRTFGPVTVPSFGIEGGF